MDEERIGSEIWERIELRGLTPEQILSDPDAARQYWEIISEAAEDATMSMVLWGHAPGFGTLADFLGDGQPDASQPEP